MISGSGEDQTLKLESFEDQPLFEPHNVAGSANFRNFGSKVVLILLGHFCYLFLKKALSRQTLAKLLHRSGDMLIQTCCNSLR